MELKHIRVVKIPWQMSSQYHALTQMLRIIEHMEKMHVTVTTTVRLT